MPIKRSTNKASRQTLSTGPQLAQAQHDLDYPLFEQAVRERRNVFASEPLFLPEDAQETDPWVLYLQNLPPTVRQLHNCSCCKAFIRRYAGLVRITPAGTRESVLWYPEGVPYTYWPAVKALANWAERERAELRPFFASTPVLGTPETGPWKHLWVSVGTRTSAASPSKASGLICQGAESVGLFLSEHPLNSFQDAVKLLDVGALSRSEKFLAPAKWLLDRKLESESTKHRGRAKALLLRACAEAPEGFLHPRAGVLGQLFDWFSSRAYDTHALRRMFEVLVGPLAYQRPKAAPSERNIERAERLFAEKGLATALGRRFARLDECELIWASRASAASPKDGLFAHLKAKSTSPQSLIMPRRTLTWTRFAEEVLPEALTLEAKLGLGADRFYAFTGPEDPSAPGLFKWPNTYGWFCYPNGSPAQQWGLKPGQWYQVEGVSQFPNLWGAQGVSFAHLGEGVLLALRGCMDTRDSGLGLFPECLRGDLHEVRVVIEAHSRSGSKLGRPNGQLACGLGFAKGSGDSPLGTLLRVNGTYEYLIDRWH